MKVDGGTTKSQRSAAHAAAGQLRYTLASHPSPATRLMNRRRFLAASAALPLGRALTAYGQQRPLRFADMHSHIGMLQSVDNLRGALAKNGMLIVARKIIA